MKSPMDLIFAFAIFLHTKVSRLSGPERYALAVVVSLAVVASCYFEVTWVTVFWQLPIADTFYRIATEYTTIIFIGTMCSLILVVSRSSDWVETTDAALSPPVKEAKPLLTVLVTVLVFGMFCIPMYDAVFEAFTQEHHELCTFLKERKDLDCEHRNKMRNTFSVLYMDLYQVFMKQFPTADECETSTKKADDFCIKGTLFEYMMQALAYKTADGVTGVIKAFVMFFVTVFKAAPLHWCGLIVLGYIVNMFRLLTASVTGFVWIVCQCMSRVWESIPSRGQATKLAKKTIKLPVRPE